MQKTFSPRQFVWCQFPYSEEPLRPGPDEHVGYVADIRKIDGNAHLTVMSLYTTTTKWEPGMRLPLGVIPVDPGLAAKMNQKGFVMDARRVAFIPVKNEFFPRLKDPDKGIVHTASLKFHTLVENTLMELARRPELVVRLGPDVPGMARRPSRTPRDEDSGPSDPTGML